MNPIVLIDLSSVAHPIWHTSQSDPDVNATSTRTVARIRALSTGLASVAVCADNGRSFRKDLDPQYKANRPEADAALHHQIALAKEILLADGFPVWEAKGFEADDVLATATRRALEIPDANILIVSADKDLLQLVGPRVQAKSLTTGNTLDEAGVAEKFGVLPSQMCDYLTLVGDSSDNVRGAKGIGPKKAADLLKKYGDLDTLYAKLDEAGPADLGIGKADAASLEEFRTRMPLTRSLIALRDDVDIPFKEILAERRPKDSDFNVDEKEEMMESEAPTGLPDVRSNTFVPLKTGDVIDAEILGTPNTVLPPVSSALAVREREPEILAPAPSEWERALDPRSMNQARELAKDMFSSRMFSAYGNPAAVLSTVMVGRELGLPAMASLRGIHVVEGRHCLSSALMVALVLKSGMALYFESISFDEKQATFETHRKGARNPVRLTHTLEMARTAGLVKDKSNWIKSPVDMLVARAQSRLARLVYPDLLAGLYSPEELEEMRNA